MHVYIYKYVYIKTNSAISDKGKRMFVDTPTLI